MYQYSAAILRCIDGDTVEATIDLGFSIRYTTIGRLDGINAPEMPTPEGVAARSALASLVLGKTLEVRTIKDHREKYGRILMVIMLEDGVTSANQVMIDQGHAVPYPGHR